MKTEVENQKAIFYEHRKKRRRKIVLKRILTAVVTIVITSGLIYGGLVIYGYFNPTVYDSGFIPAPYGALISKNVQKAKNLEIPDWIDSQIIDIHSTARTGFRLTDIKNIVMIISTANAPNMLTDLCGYVENIPAVANPSLLYLTILFVFSKSINKFLNNKYIIHHLHKRIKNISAS